jgi:hypothetical protein
MLSHQELEQPEQFGDTIRALLNDASVPIGTVAKTLQCSELMIELWRNNRRLPARDAWPNLTSSIVSLIEEELVD